MIFWQRIIAQVAQTGLHKLHKLPFEKQKSFVFFCETTFYFFLFHEKMANGQIIQENHLKNLQKTK